MNILIATNEISPQPGCVAHDCLAHDAAQLAAAYRSAGHEVLVIAPANDAGSESSEEMLRVPVFQNGNGSDLSASVELPSTCRERVNAFAPEVVLVQEPFLLGVAAAELASELQLPLFYRPLIDLRCSAAYVPVDAPELERLTGELETAVCNLSSCVLACSPSHATALQQRRVETPIRVAPAGIDLARFAHADRAAGRELMNLQRGDVVVGCAGDATDERGLRFLGRSLDAFLKSRRDAQLLIFGGEQAAERIRRWIPSRRLWERVRWTGTLADEAAADVFAAMNVAVHASRVESEPRFVLNALAAGVPVIALDAPGVRDLIVSGENGRVVAGGRRAFVAAMNEFADDGDRERRPNRGGKSLATFQLEECVDRDLRVFSEWTATPVPATSSEDRSRFLELREQLSREWRRWSRRLHADREGPGAHGSPLWRTLVRLWRGVRSWMSRREWSVKLFDLPVSEGTADEPGLVLIQIDGLARGQLEEAIRKGRMPFLKQLRDREFYSTHTMYSGIPSTTPAVLGELFYGVEQAVPAFGFRDRDTGNVVEMVQPETAARVQNRLAAEGAGLLGGGVVYCDIYSGGADDSSFCPATTGWRNLEDASMWRRTGLFLLNLMSLLRITVLAVAELCVAVVDFVRGVRSGKEFGRELFDIPRRVLVNIILREFVAISVEADVTRGVRVVHANLLGYDESAHRRGPDALFAHFALGGIDHVIHRIWDAAHSSRRRDYSVWIMSDHGQESVIPYPHETGFELDERVAEIYQESLRAERSSRTSGLGPDDGEPSKSTPDPQSETPQAEMQKPVTVAVGPIGYIHWPVNLSTEETEQIARRLVAEAKIPLVLARIDGRVRAWNAAGCFPFPERAADVLDPDHPELETAADELVRLCSHRDAGDFLISGWRNEGRPMSFIREHGAHGGPGPQETQGFVLLSADAPGLKEGERPFRPGSLRRLVQAVLNRDALSHRGSTGAQRSLRIVTYNVHSCIGTDGRRSTARIARVLAAARPDVVALQELDVDRRSSGFVDQAQQIARALEMELYFHPSFGVEEELYGNAILSRFPMRRPTAGILPRHSNRHEPRGVLWVEIDVHGARVQILNTHFGLSAREQQFQVEQLLGPDWLEEAAGRGPVVLCGDFNASPWSRTYRALTGELRDAQLCPDEPRPRSTWLSRFPFRRIDHVFVDDGWTVHSAEVVRTRLARVASDHLPLVVEVEPLGEPEPGDPVQESAGVEQISTA